MALAVNGGQSAVIQQEHHLAASAAHGWPAVRGYGLRQRGTGSPQIIGRNGLGRWKDAANLGIKDIEDSWRK